MHKKVVLLLAYLISTLLITENATAEIEIIPLSPSQEDSEEWIREIFQSPTVTRITQTGKLRLLSSDFEEGKFSLGTYHESSKRHLEIKGNLNENNMNDFNSGLVRVKVKRLTEQPPPSPEEFENAVAVLSRNDFFGELIRNNKIQTYKPMPMLLDTPTEGGDRILTVGIKPLHPEVKHEIVSVNLNTENVTRFPSHAPKHSFAAPQTCGPVSSRQPVTRKGVSGSAIVKFVRDGTELWSLQVVRPSASSGYWGSGIEIRNVRFKGRKILERAHVPILNVNYERNACGPFRDIAYEENAFQARGQTIASGIIKASQRPKTIFETGSDRGNFRGVAIFEESDEESGALVLTSELSAGWYRYVSEWKFHRNGMIEPIFKLSAVNNSCTCKSHDHHVYWRFDFDLDTRTPNSVYARKNGEWIKVRSESAHLKKQGYSSWRVVNPTTRLSYEIRPGIYETPVNQYGRGDVWILKYKKGEIDDRSGWRGTEAKLAKFINGESVSGNDIVFWYAGHVRHAPESNETPHIAGPKLIPVE